MRSIIDEIALAEEQAEQIRQESVSAARELLNASRLEAEREYVRVEDEEREKMREALEKAEQDGQQQAEQTLKELAATADLQCEEAKLRVGDAVQYLLKKVQEIA